VNLLARFSEDHCQRHWDGLKEILRYLIHTKHHGVYYTRKPHLKIEGYVDAGHMSDLTSGKSQTGYVFLVNGTAVSWKSKKQTLSPQSTNHSELIAVQLAIRHAIPLYHLILALNPIMNLGLNEEEWNIKLHEDNQAVISQINGGRLDSSTTQFYSRDLWFAREHQGIEVKLVPVSGECNIADALTKTLGRVKLEYFNKQMNLINNPKLNN
jgi:hypothetical protein